MKGKWEKGLEKERRVGEGEKERDREIEREKRRKEKRKKNTHNLITSFITIKD